MDLSSLSLNTTLSPSDAKAAQTLLRAAKCYNGTIDGNFGYFSRAALYTWNVVQANRGTFLRFVARSAVFGFPAVGEAPAYFGWTGPGNVDGDGGENVEHDPCWQPDTSLHYDGRPINSREVPGLVVTIGEIEEVPGVVLGAESSVTNIETGKTVQTVVYDTGGPEDDGEMSIQAAIRVGGVDPNPVTGGQPHPIFWYQVAPDNRANVDGIEYPLTAL